MFRTKIRDPVVLGMTCGAIGTAAKMLGNLFNRHVLKKSDTTYVEIAAGLFMNKEEREKPVGRIVGFLADYALGAMLGVPLVYVLKYTGKDHAFLKGLGYGHFAWIGMYGAVGRALLGQAEASSRSMPTRTSPRMSIIAGMG